MNNTFILILKIIALLIILNYSARLLTKTLGEFNKYFHVSGFAIGIVFMAVATSIPELFIGIQSALNNASSLSLGTALGSNISILTLILGIITLSSRFALKPNKYVKTKDAWWMFIYALVPIILSIDGQLSKVDGIILLIMFIIYTYYIFLSKQKFVEKFAHFDKKSFILDIIKFIIGIGLLLFSSNYLVKYGLELADSFAIPVLVLGISIYALSASLPELIFSLSALKQNKEQILFGNLIGSVIVNSSLVLGITAIIYPIIIENIVEYIPAILVLFIASGYFFYKVLNAKKLLAIDGFLLLAGYLIFIIIEFGIIELKF